MRKILKFFWIFVVLLAFAALCFLGFIFVFGEPVEGTLFDSAWGIALKEFIGICFLTLAFLLYHFGGEDK